MKAEFRSRITKFGTDRNHIEIPSYVREDFEDYIGKCIKVIIKKKSDKNKNQLSFESRITNIGHERIHIEIPASNQEESKKLLGEKIKIIIQTQ